METTIANKLKALYKLQALHTQIDKIRQLKGLLPEEVSDYEDKIVGIKTRVDQLKNDLDALKHEFDNTKNLIRASNDAVSKYQSEVGSVKNNREYDALLKEIEIQHLDIQLHQKRLMKIEGDIVNKTSDYRSAQTDLEANQKYLIIKKDELDKISAETQAKEKELTQLALDAGRDIDSNLLAAYTLLRKKAKNGLAIVTVERDACSGCFNHTPAQQQAEIRLHQRIIVCEFCGRILVDEGLVSEGAIT
ncbi:zinc ribbon domain-containing protein [Mucilaginibacter sp. SG564]|uniref:zinc ribbon domain-containing protein n=1 Tax=Mucilaginibacter sp. SG564 TaxID=2587022 RepID=UPI001555746D|nr:C4-type zinc ribbon domain-containing protein [Mucilaginibacter sp. SG564]NOW96062.1 hypothetical protein [Mucilaginibacter sp. SG564]